MEFLFDYGLFLLKTVTLVIAILILTAGIFSVNRKPKPKLEVTSLNKHYAELQKKLTREIKNKKQAKKLSRENKKKQEEEKPSLFILEFDGDIKATQTDNLREEITAILSIIEPKDEVVIKIESPGGSVNGYGLAAAELIRIRERGIKLTACIDRIAASGGYLMAATAHHIVASPFAIIGSIGVVAQIPNFHRFLKKNNIDVELLTAGEYKRTLTVLGENTEKGRQKFQEDLEKIHTAFRDYVLVNRQPILEASDMQHIATGEHWLAADALPLKLVDTLKTSDDYLIEKMAQFNLFQISTPTKSSLAKRLMRNTMKLLHPF